MVSNENEQLTSENENTTLPNNAQPNNHKETLSQEQKINLENVQRIMNSEKTTLPSLRNIEWRTLMIETNKINQILPYIPTNKINELNELIYAGAKLVYEKIGIPSKSTKKKSKPGWEIRLETQIKKITETGQNGKRCNIREKKGKGNARKNNTTRGNKPESTGEGREIKKISTKGKIIETK